MPTWSPTPHVSRSSWRYQTALRAVSDRLCGLAANLLGRRSSASIERPILAVLKLTVTRPLTALELGDSEALTPGELVMAFGSPLGLANSVSLGIVRRGRASATC